eukprot:COSAG02_NODE_4928_length_4823_cov_19.146486_7_plen_142_part_00
MYSNTCTVRARGLRRYSCTVVLLVPVRRRTPVLRTRVLHLYGRPPPPPAAATQFHPRAAVPGQTEFAWLLERLIGDDLAQRVRLGVRGEADWARASHTTFHTEKSVAGQATNAVAKPQHTAQGPIDAEVEPMAAWAGAYAV